MLNENDLKIASDLELLALTGAYDAQLKKYFMNRDILAVILKYAVSEFADLDIDEISLLIDPDSITEDREVSYDRTNSIRGENTDFSSVSEKTVNFDILFSAVNPRLSNETVKVNLYIDLEPQGDYTPGYHIQSRGMYYLSRALSSQLGIITDKTDYSQLEKVYSIWICYRNIPKDLQNSISFYKMTNYKNIGIEQDDSDERDDLMELVIIRVGDDTDQQMPELIEFLSASLQGDATRASKYINIDNITDSEKEVPTMKGAGAMLFERAMEQGIQQGIEQGIEETKLIFKLHMSGFSNEQISTQTGLPLEKIIDILS